MKKIGWVLPDGDYQSGSGGLKTLFDHIGCISNEYQQEVYVNTLNSAKFVYNQLKNYPNIIISSSYKDIIKDLDLLIATHSMTAEIVENTEAKQKAYFIQDLEYLFYPMSSNYIKAMQSYQYNFHKITMGEWLGSQLNAKYRISFCADLNIYKPIYIKKKNAICFMYQPEKPWRCSELGIEALKLVKKQMPDLTIYLYGSNAEHYFEGMINLGQLSLEDCNKLYNTCKLGVCFSPTNPSRIPFEMMAAGLPVLDLSYDNKVDFPKDKDILWKANTNAKDIASEIMHAIFCSDYLEKQSLECIEFMQSRPLELAYEQFSSIISNILGGENE